MTEEINVNFIKKWIQDNLPESRKKNLTIFEDEYEDVKEILSKLKQDHNIAAIPMKEIVTGKKSLRKIRTMLQNEVHDWTLYPYLEAQSSFNLSLIELLEHVISDLKKQSDEITFLKSQLNDKQKA